MLGLFVPTLVLSLLLAPLGEAERALQRLVDGGAMMAEISAEPSSAVAELARGAMRDPSHLHEPDERTNLAQLSRR
ncbi:hypothetical protein [Streptomyces olivochromogenes]|uniref:hypothetical protein n=1 Tax=Streptomyces olivochromogenes TaxID=1963 RepID=UPI001F431489|nr:hypothetical protein [Streptomyces olivochromogenes]MCF3130174.1 hypothetical protein [Streptomyces olivochromogenes]